MLYTISLIHLVSYLFFFPLSSPTVEAVSAFQQDFTEQWKILEGEEYEIQYPAAWDLDQTGQRGTSFVLFAPLDSTADAFRENIGLMIQDLTNYDLNLDQYTELSEEQVRTIFPNSRILESKRIQYPAGDYHRLMYLGDSDVFHLKFVQHFWVNDNHAYVLTFVAEQASFDSYQETGEQIMNTFKLK